MANRQGRYDTSRRKRRGATVPKRQNLRRLHRPKLRNGLRAITGRVPAAVSDRLIRALPGLGIEQQVVRSIDEHGKNTLWVDHRIPEGATGRVRYRVTTQYQVLPETFFGRRARREISEASLERGRAIYCVDLATDQVTAALAYHVPDRGRLVVRAIAIRVDGDDPKLWQRSRLDLVICKAYLHVFAEKVGRTAELIYDADTREAGLEARGLGFRSARKVIEIRPSGFEVLAQPKLGR